MNKNLFQRAFEYVAGRLTDVPALTAEFDAMMGKAKGVEDWCAGFCEGRAKAVAKACETESIKDLNAALEAGVRVAEAEKVKNEVRAAIHGRAMAFLNTDANHTAVINFLRAAAHQLDTEGNQRNEAARNLVRESLGGEIGELKFSEDQNMRGLRDRLLSAADSLANGVYRLDRNAGTNEAMKCVRAILRRDNPNAG